MVQLWHLRLVGGKASVEGAPAMAPEDESSAREALERGLKGQAWGHHSESIGTPMTSQKYILSSMHPGTLDSQASLAPPTAQ